MSIATAPKTVDTNRPADNTTRMTAAVNAFLIQEDRWPSRTGGDANETYLANWLANVRAAHRNGAMRPARRDTLDQEIPGWLIGNRATPTFDDNFAGLRRFVARTGQEPKPYSGNWDERRLAAWYSRHRHNARLGVASSNHAAAFAAQFGEDWLAERESGHGDDRFAVVALRVAAHRESTGAFPTRRDTDKAMASAGIWLTNNRKFARDGILPERRIRLLDTVIPGWRGGNLALAIGADAADTDLPANASEAAFTLRVKQLEAFVEGKGRMPMLDTEDKGESSLAAWAANQRDKKRRKCLTPAHKAQLNSAVPGWTVSPEGRRRLEAQETAWNTRLDQVREFAAEHGHLPRDPRTAGVSEVEAQLNMWLSKQKRKARAGKLEAKVRGRLEKVAGKS